MRMGRNGWGYQIGKNSQKKKTLIRQVKCLWIMRIIIIKLMTGTLD